MCLVSTDTNSWPGEPALQGRLRGPEASPRWSPESPGPARPPPTRSHSGRSQETPQCLCLSDGGKDDEPRRCPRLCLAGRRVVALPVSELGSGGEARGRAFRPQCRPHRGRKEGNSLLAEGSGWAAGAAARGCPLSLLRPSSGLGVF